jgi:hypothetical protein
VRRNGDGYMARCPAHEDRTPSLSVKDGADGRVVLYCHAGCTTEAVCEAHGHKLRDLAPPDPDGNGNGRRRIVASYRYDDAHGQHLFDVVRFDPKDFRQRRPDGNGGWVWNLKGVTRVLYHLPDVLRVVEAGGAVWVVEGEKDADKLHPLLADVGAAATTNPGGAGKWRWEYSDVLRGANVVIVADRDDPGREHAQGVAEKLEDVAGSVCIVEPVEGKDAADHLAAGKTLGEFQQVRWGLNAPDAVGLSRDERGDTALLRSPKERSTPTPQQPSTPPTASTPDAVAPFAVPLGAFLDKPRDPVPALAADSDGRPVIARKSLVMLGARGGRGKTTLAIDWMIHLALGEDYLCFSIPEPARILIVENEGPEEQFAEKLRDRVVQLSAVEQQQVRDRIHVYCMDWGGFNLAAMMNDLVAYIDEHEFDLVFGDPLDALGIDGVGSPEDTRRFLALMKDAGLNSRSAWWLNTHPRKEETREAIDEIAGAWGGKPDTIMLLDLLPDDRSRIRFPKIRWAKRGTRPNILLAYDADAETFTYLGDEEDDERDYLFEITDRLADGQWRTVKEIAQPKDKGGIGAGESTIKALLEQHPDTFHSCTGRAAARLERSTQAILWNLVEVEAS